MLLCADWPEAAAQSQSSDMFVRCHMLLGRPLRAKKAIWVRIFILTAGTSHNNSWQQPVLIVLVHPELWLRIARLRRPLLNIPSLRPLSITSLLLLLKYLLNISLKSLLVQLNITDLRLLSII